jgi:ABC-type dipeptide/oligopeptide/nickel transport system permease component
VTASMRTRDRLAASFVLAVMAVACLGLFIGVPLGVLWGLSKLTDSFATHFVGGLLGIPLAIALLSPALFWLNGLYLRITGAHRDEEEWDELYEPAFRVRGPLEPMLVAAFAIALVALIVWFFFFAENPVLTT